MQPLFDFIGGYWWLMFPIMGMAGGLGGYWRQASKQRHKRRLEIIKAKGDAKAAQLAARANPTAVNPITAGVDAAMAAAMGTAVVEGGESQAVRLQRLFDSHDAVTKRWLDYELDVAKLIAYPAMSDGRQPLTAAFLRAKKFADGLRPASAKARLTKEQFSEYRDAVTDYEVAFDLAERDAKRLKDSTFTEMERKRLATAQQLLGVAVDQAATPAERQLAYRRVRQELDGLISVSDEAIDVLKERVGLQLSAGPTPPASAPTPTPAPQPETLPVRRADEV